jgi:hypothetical protein
MKKSETRWPTQRLALFLCVRWRDSCPATPISCTRPVRKSTDPNTESISRWIARSCAVWPVEAPVVPGDKKGRYACPALWETLDPCDYLIWDDMWEVVEA